MRKMIGSVFGTAIMIPLLWCAGALAESFPAVKIYEKTAKSVVLIVASDSGKSVNVGAGSLIDASGLVLTCAHVFMPKEPGAARRSVQVYLKPDKVVGDFQRDLTRRYEASVVAVDENLDLAVLKVVGLPGNMDRLELANPEEINIGEEVVAIGHPEQGGLWSLTYGRISGEIQKQMGTLGKDVYQTDTSVNRGNSGGPLLDRRGYIVGVNANVARVGAGNMPITGVNFAIKSVVVKKWLEGKGYRVAYGTIPMEGTVTSQPPVGKVATETPAMAVPVKAQPVEQEKPVQKASPVAEAGTATKPILEVPKSVAAPEKGKSIVKAEAGGSKSESDRILTPKKPYRIEDMFTAVEKEIEDLMEEMRGKVRR